MLTIVNNEAEMLLSWSTKPILWSSLTLTCAVWPTDGLVYKATILLTESFLTESLRVSFITLSGFSLCGKLQSAWTVWTWSSLCYCYSTYPSAPTRSTSWSWCLPSGLLFITSPITSQRAIRTKYSTYGSVRSSPTCTACLRKLFRGFMFWSSAVLHFMITQSCCS